MTEAAYRYRLPGIIISLLPQLAVPQLLPPRYRSCYRSPTAAATSSIRRTHRTPKYDRNANVRIAFNENELVVVFAEDWCSHVADTRPTCASYVGTSINLQRIKAPKTGVFESSPICRDVIVTVVRLLNNEPLPTKDGRTQPRLGHGTRRKTH